MATTSGEYPAPGSERPAPRGLFGRLAGWLRGRRQPVALTPATLVVQERREGPEPLTVPADGGVFSFTVHYHTTWTAKGMHPARFVERVNAYADSAAHTLLDQVWPIGRGCLPHHPEQAEAEMNKKLAEPWCYEEHGEVISCRAQVQVTADERVVTRQLPLWERLVEMDLRYRVERRRLEVVDDLLGRWRDLLERFGDGPVVGQAARLVDTEVATVVRGLATERRSLSHDLAEVLRSARDAHHTIGMFEFAQSYDAALRAFERQAGLTRGTVTPDSRPDATSAGG
ncbi:hypothetical protein [Gandjariella thermophila]|nr:hypothetical protein [Gandjariella thermophila]